MLWPLWPLTLSRGEDYNRKKVQLPKLFMQFNDLTYASSVHYIANGMIRFNDKAVSIVESTLGSEWSFFSAHAPWLPMCGVSGYEGCPRWCFIFMKQSNWKVGCKEQDLKKRWDFHFLLCSMIESLVNVNTNRIFLAGVEKFWYEFCIYTLC